MWLLDGFGNDDTLEGSFGVLLIDLAPSVLPATPARSA
jgi:hypothetical protein